MRAFLLRVLLWWKDASTAQRVAGIWLTLVLFGLTATVVWGACALLDVKGLLVVLAMVLTAWAVRVLDTSRY